MEAIIAIALLPYTVPVTLAIAIVVFGTLCAASDYRAKNFWFQTNK